MINVPQQFKDAVYSQTKRSVAARITFDISDVTAADDAAETVTSEASFSRSDQLTDGRTLRPAYATFETDYWRLDGTFVLPPKLAEAGFEVGWYSDEMSDGDGDFATAQVADFEFSEPHSSIGISITFDVPADEYAVDFDIVAYDGVGAEIDTINVRGNTLARYVLEQSLSDYERITITVLSWSRADRRAKIVEVSFGVIRVYEDDKLVSLNIVEEVVPTSETVPANELKFVVDNRSREFNILNPTGIYSFLQQRQTVFAELGVEVSPGAYIYVGMGSYYLREWKSDEGSLTTTFTARDQLDFISNEEIENSTPQGTNLHDLAVATLEAAGVTRYIVDSALSSIATEGIHPKMIYRDKLQLISVAGRCVLFVDRDDYVNLVRMPSAAAVDTIDFDNVYSEPQIHLDTLVSRVDVVYYSGTSPAGTFSLAGSSAGGIALKVDNMLIDSLQVAQDVAAWILAERGNRSLYEINWRQNPALECLDKVTVEDAYGANKDSIITRQEFQYQGYLAGKTKTRG